MGKVTSKGYTNNEKSSSKYKENEKLKFNTCQNIKSPITGGANGAVTTGSNLSTMRNAPAYINFQNP